MPDIISAIGVVGTPPSLTIVSNGLARLTFRLGSTHRKFNREANGWENGETNWYTVVAFRRLAENAGSSLAKGDRVVVTGRLKVDDWENGGKHGTTVELLADGIGHDLAFGTSTFTKGAAITPIRTESSDAPAGDAALQSSERPAVDSGGWALPGGANAGSSSEPAIAEAGVTADGGRNTDVAIDTEPRTDRPEAGRSEFSPEMVETPF